MLPVMATELRPQSDGVRRKGGPDPTKTGASLAGWDRCRLRAHGSPPLFAKFDFLQKQAATQVLGDPSCADPIGETEPLSTGCRCASEMIVINYPVLCQNSALLK